MSGEVKFTILEGAGLWGGRLLSLSAVDSTNTWACGNIDILQDGDVIITRSQTAGRGRFDRSWLSSTESIALSAVIRRIQDSGLKANASRAAAVAVAECLEDHDLDARLKWPNDVMVGERKIAGLLAEQADDGNALIIGIGLNVNVAETDFEAAELKDTATSMTIEKSRQFDTGQVEAWLLSELETAFDRYLAEGHDFLSAEWAKRDWITGRRVSVRSTDRIVTGRYAGVNEEGQMLLRTAPGRHETFWSGDVTVIPAE